MLETGLSAVAVMAFSPRQELLSRSSAISLSHSYGAEIWVTVSCHHRAH
jgi:hypothetical protein